MIDILNEKNHNIVLDHSHVIIIIITTVYGFGRFDFRFTPE